MRLVVSINGISQSADGHWWVHAELAIGNIARRVLHMIREESQHVRSAPQCPAVLPYPDHMASEPCCCSMNGMQ